MSLEFENLRIERLIVHEIFKRDIDREIIAPKCSNELTRLDHTGLQVFQDRIIKSMGNGSHCIEMSITDESESSTFQCCAKLLDADDDHFIELSKHLALKLSQAQASRIIPGGILVIFNGTVSATNKRYIGIIKAEMHNGFVKEDGDNAILLKHLSELLLTPQQKLYKIGFFAEVNGRQYPDDLRSSEDFVSYA
ncbi:nucleoid-associated protein [Thermodesulfobacteriota bacterium B35]